MGLKHKTILVIGGLGFIGSTLSKLLISKGYDIDIYDINEPTGNPHHIIKTKRLAYNNTILHSCTLDDIYKHEYDYVIHLGSFVEVGDNTEDYFKNNNGELQKYIDNILYKKFIYISSSSILEDVISPYSISIKIAEAQIRNYCPADYLIIRHCTVYGENGIPDKLITKLLNQEIVNINGDPKLISRYFIYVGDLVKLIMNNLDRTGIINVKSHKQYTLDEILSIFGYIEGKDYFIEESDNRTFKKYLTKDGIDVIMTTSIEKYIRSLK